MTRAYVYGPFNQASRWGQEVYAYYPGEQHQIIGNRANNLLLGGGWQFPMDFGHIVGPTQVHCQVSPEITRIVVSYYDGICGGGRVASNGVVCHLYANTGRLIGTMLYGHMRPGASRIAPGEYTGHHARNYGGLELGHPAPDCGCYPCADKVHVRVQAQGAAGYIHYDDKTYVNRAHSVWYFDY